MKIEIEKAPPGAVHNKAIVLCCDQGYVKYATFVINQIFDQHPNPDFDVCLCSMDDLVLPETLSHLPVRVLKVDVGSVLRGAPKNDRLPSETYLRLALPDFFEGQYLRLLYLDCDVFLRPSDLSRLLDIDLQRQDPIAAARAVPQRLNPSFRAMEFRSLGRPAAPYFNAGIIVIDTRRWISQDVFERCLEILAEHPEVMLHMDQSAMNLILANQWTEMSGAWNWLYSRPHRYMAEFADPFILHFAGPKKAWDTDVGLLPPQYPRAYRDFFKAHFPDAYRDMKPETSSVQAIAAHLDSMKKQFDDLDALVRYMARFDDPFHTLPT